MDKLKKLMCPKCENELIVDFEGIVDLTWKCLVSIDNKEIEVNQIPHLMKSVDIFRQYSKYIICDKCNFSYWLNKENKRSVDTFLKEYPNCWKYVEEIDKLHLTPCRNSPIPDGLVDQDGNSI